MTQKGDEMGLTPTGLRIDTTRESIWAKLASDYGWSDADLAALLASVEPGPPIQEVMNAPDRGDAIEAVEKIPGSKFERPTLISYHSASLGLRVVQSIRYVWPATDRRWGAEAGRESAVQVLREGAI